MGIFSSSGAQRLCWEQMDALFLWAVRLASPKVLLLLEVLLKRKQTKGNNKPLENFKEKKGNLTQS